MVALDGTGGTSPNPMAYRHLDSVYATESSYIAAHTRTYRLLRAPDPIATAGPLTRRHARECSRRALAFDVISDATSAARAPTSVARPSVRLAVDRVPGSTIDLDRRRTFDRLLPHASTDRP